jgi:hypothetical protein
MKKQILQTLFGFSAILIFSVLTKLAFDATIFLVDNYKFNLQNCVIICVAFVVLLASNRVGRLIIE